MKRLPRKQNKWLELEISQAIDRYCVLSSKHRMQISCNKVIYGLASCADARQGRHAFPLSPPHVNICSTWKEATTTDCQWLALVFKKNQRGFFILGEGRE